jgi:hypothetical protein
MGVRDLGGKMTEMAKRYAYRVSLCGHHHA